MFLYSRLSLDFIASNIFYTLNEVKNSIQQLPPKLHDLSVSLAESFALLHANASHSYAKILTQVIRNLDERSMARVKCMLGWIAFAKRPLRKFEFLSAISFSE